MNHGVSSKNDTPRLTLIHGQGISYEGVRLALNIGKIKYEMLKEKLNDRSLQSGVALDVNDIVEAYGLPGILRYVGELSAQYPEDPFKALYVDELMEKLEGLRAHVTQAYAEKNRAKRKAMTDQLRDCIIPSVLDEIEEDIVKSSSHNYWSTATVSLEETPHFVGNTFTVADIDLAATTRWIVSGYLEGLPKDLLSEYMHIGKIARGVYAKAAEENDDERPRREKSHRGRTPSPSRIKKPSVGTTTMKRSDSPPPGCGPKGKLSKKAKEMGKHEKSAGQGRAEPLEDESSEEEDLPPGEFAIMKTNQSGYIMKEIVESIEDMHPDDEMQT